MFSLRKRVKAPASAPQTGIRETVAGITSQIDQLVAIVRDAGAPISDRVTACEIVRSFVEFQSLSSITEIWYAMRESTALENPTEVRRAGWRLAESCIDHDEVNNSAFTAYYSSIIRNSNIEDFDLVLTCLEHLTKGGRKVVGSQAPRHLPRVLLEWIQMLAVRTQELRSNPLAQDITRQWGFSTEEAFYRCLTYTAQLLKFNMAVWDPIEIEKLMLIVVSIVRTTSQITDCELCCTLIDSVIAFGLVPAQVLQPVLEVLCGMSAMIPALKPKCVPIVRKLSKSHLQNSTIVRLCRILDTPSSEITQSMRIAAAHQLCDLIISEQGIELEHGHALGNTGTTTDGSELSSSDVSAGPSSVASSFIQNPGLHRLNSTTSSVLDDSTASKSEIKAMDVSLPVLDVLESYYRTLRSDSCPLRLTLVIFDCFYELVIEYDLLKRVHTSSWLSPDSESEEDSKVSPTSIVREFSDIYARVAAVTPADNEDLINFQTKMRKLGTALTDRLLEKMFATSLSSQILICAHISHFLDTAACDKLLNAIETLQFCTPGVSNWFQNLTEIMNKVYLERSDKCRARVLRIVSDIYTLDAEEEGWISTEDLDWITNTTFSIIGSADEETLTVLAELYRKNVFYSSSEVFETATRQLVNAAVGYKGPDAQSVSSDTAANTQSSNSNNNGNGNSNGNGISSSSSNNPKSKPQPLSTKTYTEQSSLKSVEALTVAFGQAYRLYTRQALVVLNGLFEICSQTVDSPNVFAKAWAVICRLRVDRWDRLLLVNHRLEEGYSEELRAEQEPLPPQLEAIHAIPSLVLKVKSQETESEHIPTVDTSPILDIMLKVLRDPKTKERTLIVTLINAASQLAHYRLLCEADQEIKLPKLIELRDELEALVSSGGSKIPQSTMSSSVKKSAILCVVLHILSVLIPFEPLYTKTERDKLVNTLVTALGRWNLSTGWVVHCFTLTCYEAPSSLQRYLPQILSRLQLKITGRDSSMFILDFLLSLSLEGSLTKNFTQQDFKRVFGMCFSFIQNANDLLTLRYQSDITAQWLLKLAYGAVCNLFLSMQLENRRSLVPYLVRSLVLATRDSTGIDPMSLVVYDMINRFTYSDVPLRAHMETVPKSESHWETRRWMRGFAIIEIRCNRKTGEAVRIVRRPAGIFTTYMTPAVISGLGSGFDPLDFEDDESTGNYTANFYLMCGQLGLGTFLGSKGNIITAEKASVVTASQRSGGGLNSPRLHPTQSNHLGSNGNNSGAQGGPSTLTSTRSVDSSQASVSISEDRNSSGSAATPVAGGAAGGAGAGTAAAAGGAAGINGSKAESISMEAQESGVPLAGTSIPLALPNDAATNRAMGSLDRVPIVDLHKIGIIYCAPGQTQEAEILANSSGSSAYRRFLDKIGVLIRLKHNRMYYVGGLDTEQDLDGEYALAWSSKIGQIIFHTITMMPNYEGDTQFASKKRHIGNNFVNIYFDESGEDFEFELVKSQFNFINIVITPTYTKANGGQRYWKVRAYRKPGMKNTLAAYDVKVVSDDNLPLFTRNLALKASQYAAIHNLGADYRDNWVYRFQLISTLRERVEQAQAQQAASSKRDEDDESKAANDDDYLATEESSESSEHLEDLKQLNWMDFTRFTI